MTHPSSTDHADPISLLLKATPVPRRFSIGSLLIVTAASAVLLGALRALDAALEGALLLGVLACIAVAQMIFPKSPRLASAATGAVLFPCVLVILSAVDGFQGSQFLEVVQVALYLSPFCAIFGYLGGLLVSGVFLVCDRLLGIGRGERPKTEAMSPSVSDTKPTPLRQRLGFARLFTIFITGGLLVALLKAIEARAADYLFALTLFAAISIMQSIWRNTPRVASVVAGAFLLPLTHALAAFVLPSDAMDAVVPYVLGPADPIRGAILGYMGGVAVASVFLLQERICAALSDQQP